MGDDTPIGNKGKMILSLTGFNMGRRNFTLEIIV